MAHPDDSDEAPEDFVSELLVALPLIGLLGLVVLSGIAALSFIG
jgi:hypothetical protein